MNNNFIDVNNHLIETNVRKKNEKKSIVFKDKTPFFSNSASIILKKRELPPKISANAENNNIAKVYPKNLTSKEERSYKSPIIENFRPTNFLNNMMLILKAARKLIFRSRFRNIKGLKDIQLDLIGDSVFFHEREKKNYFLKRYIEANHFKKAYYVIMSLLFTSTIMKYLIDKSEKIIKAICIAIPVIKPYQKGKVFWDIIIFFIIIFYFFMIPLQLSFDFLYDEKLEHQLEHSLHFSHSQAKFLLFIPEFWLIIDSSLKLITGYYENGVVIIDKSKIVKHYLKKGLILDFLSYFPIIAQTILKTNLLGVTVLKFLQLLMFCKIKRVQIILTNFQEMISLKGKNDYILSLVNLLYQIMFFTHIMACVWHAVAYYNVYDGESNWLNANNMKELDWVTRYLNSLFWAVSVMTTISNNHLTPQNNIELVFGILIFLVSSVFFGYALNSMREIFNLMSKSETEYKETLSVINNFMKTNAIPFELQGKVRKYLEHLMKKHQNSEKETAILDKLTNTLKKDVILQSNGKFLSQIPFLKKNFSNESLEELSFFMKKIQFCPEEYIFKMNQLDDCSIFLLASGNLETVLPVRDDIGKELKLNKLEKGELFGLASFFTDEPRLSSIKSNNFSTLFEIKKIDFMNIIKKRPNDFENYCMIRDKIKLYHNYEDISIKCHCCHKENHNLLHCPLLHYIPDSEFLISRANYSKNQERTLSFSRKTKKKFNSLGDRLIILQDLMKMSSEYFSNDSLSDISEEMQNKEIIPEKNSVSITETNNFQEKCEVEGESQNQIMNKSKIENYQKIPSLEQNLNSFPSKNLLTKKPSIIEENECFFEENIKAEKIILDLKPKSNYFFNKEKVPENERTPKSVQSQKSLFSKTQLLKTKTEILIPSSKIIEKETEKLKIDIFYIYEFENGKTYKNFFPNGNCENIIQKINRRMRNHDTTKISVRRKTLRIKRNLSGKKNNSKIFSPGLNENENNSPFRRIEELH